MPRFQCAICYSIGFGHAADQTLAASYLKRSGYTDGDFQAELLLLRQSRSRGFKSKQLSQQGVDFSNVDIDYIVPGELGRKYATCSREIMDLTNVLSPDHDLVLTLRRQSARLLAHLGLFEKARDTYQAVYEVETRDFGPETSHTRRTLENLAETYLSLGDYTEAEAAYTKAYQIAKNGPKSSDIVYQSVGNNLAGVLKRQGKYDEAESLLKKLWRVVKLF
jgi:tetratricopeptide (TPR) repeat protein